MRAWLGGVVLAWCLAGCEFRFSADPPGPAPVVTAGTAAEQADAIAAARAYLELIDAGRFDETWEQAGPALRQSTNRIMWNATLGAAGRMLERGRQRRIDGIGFTPSIDPGLPPGEYVAVQFSSVAGQVTTTEKVVMERVKGTWKIVGYHFNKRSAFGRSE